MSRLDAKLEHWLREQSRLQRRRYLILDALGNAETLRALLAGLPPTSYVSLYLGSEVAELASEGPFVIQLANGETPALTDLLSHPERHWGWLASAEGDALPALARHWHARMLVGQRPHMALYRFHDNQVLGRALARLAEQDLPGYLGPIASLCYWQADAGEWRSRDNSAPGEYPLPDAPAWLAAPQGDATTQALLRHNLHLYLLAGSSLAAGQLGGGQAFDTWLDETLQQARDWRWTTEEQLHFLALERLKNSRNRLAEQWQPRPGEAPERHYERVRFAARVQANGGMYP